MLFYRMLTNISKMKSKTNVRIKKSKIQLSVEV